MEDEDQVLQKSIKRLQDLSKGIISYELEAITLQGLHIVEARRGHFLCNLIVPNRVTDRDGNWHPGAMATLIDNIGSAAIYSSGQVKVSVDFSVSYYSTVKILEEVVIDARVVGEQGRLSSVLVEIRRKGNGELVALGKQWMASNSVHHNVLLADLSKGLIGHQVDAISLQGLQILEARRGYLLCRFVAPSRLSDEEGNWHVGAMTMLIEVVGGTALYSLAGQLKVAFDLSISYYSTVKIQEEVMIEAKVIGEQGRLSHALVEIRKMGNVGGNLVALGKHSASTTSLHSVTSKL